MLVGCTQITSRPPPFVEILREQGKLTQAILDEAVRIQAKERKYIGQILCEIGRLNAADIEAALALPGARTVPVDASSLADRAVGDRGPSGAGRTTLAHGCPDRLVSPAAARTKELAPIQARQAALVSRRPDLSAPFTVMLMTGLMSAGLFLSVVVQRGVPLGRVLPLAVADPFGALALVFLAAAGVMARMGDI
jgi:hypothetical protein